MKAYTEEEDELLQEHHEQNIESTIARLEARRFSDFVKDREEDPAFDFYRLTVEQYREKFLVLATDGYEVTVGPHIRKDIFYPLDVSLDMETLKKDLDRFKEYVLDLASDYKRLLKVVFPETITDVPRNTKQHKRSYDEILKSLEESYKAHRMKKFDSGSNVSIAKELGIMPMDDSSDKGFKNGDREVRRRLKHADNLIQAAINGTFCKAIEKPLPRNM